MTRGGAIEPIFARAVSEAAVSYDLQTWHCDWNIKKLEAWCGLQFHDGSGFDIVVHVTPAGDYSWDGPMGGM